MRAIAQRPGIVLRLAGGEPLCLFAPPLGKVAGFRHPAGIAGDVEPSLEAGRVLHRRGNQSEDSLERLVGEGEAPPGVELGDTGGELIEHRALRLTKGAE